MTSTLSASASRTVTVVLSIVSVTSAAPRT